MNPLNVLENFCGYQLIKSAVVWYDGGGSIPASFTVRGDTPETAVENALFEYEIKTGIKLIE
jgi:hypothetical protein